MTPQSQPPHPQVEQFNFKVQGECNHTNGKANRVDVMVKCVFGCLRFSHSFKAMGSSVSVSFCRGDLNGDGIVTAGDFFALSHRFLACF